METYEVLAANLRSAADTVERFGNVKGFRVVLEPIVAPAVRENKPRYAKPHVTTKTKHWKWTHYARKKHSARMSKIFAARRLRQKSLVLQRDVTEQ